MHCKGKPWVGTCGYWKIKTWIFIILFCLLLYMLVIFCSESFFFFLRKEWRKVRRQPTWNKFKKDKPFTRIFFGGFLIFLKNDHILYLVFRKMIKIYSHLKMLIWYIIRMNKKDFSNVSGYTGNTQKSSAVLYTSNK